MADPKLSEVIVCGSASYKPPASTNVEELIQRCRERIAALEADLVRERKLKMSLEVIRDAK